MTKNPYRQEVWTLARILRTVECGSGDWDWLEEWEKLDHAHAEWLSALEESIRREGIQYLVEIGSCELLSSGDSK